MAFPCVSFLLICLLLRLLFAAVGNDELDDIKVKWNKVAYQYPRSDNFTTNYEFHAIKKATKDFSSPSNSSNSPVRVKGLLCVTFLRASINPSINLFSNVLLMNGSCEWAIIVYDGEPKSVRYICNNPQIKRVSIHCARATDSINNKTVIVPVRKRSKGKSDKDIYVNITQKLSIPKTVLYRELLPYLKNYRHVFLLDEDISLVGFDLNTFLRIRHCAFSPYSAPLISQPLIAESNQYFRYVNFNSWQRDSLRPVIASETGLVEQQVYTLYLMTSPSIKISYRTSTYKGSIFCGIILRMVRA